MKQHFIILLFLLLGGSTTAFSQLQECALLVADHQSANPGDTVTINLTAIGFDSVSSTSFFLQWDSTVLRYHDFEVTIPGFQPGQVFGGGNSPQPDRLYLTWLHATGIPYNIPDSTVAYQLQLIVVGDVGSFSPIQFTSRNSFENTSGNSINSGFFRQRKFQSVDGSVHVGAPANDLSLQSCIPMIDCFQDQITLSAQISGGTPPYSYQWYDPDRQPISTADSLVVTTSGFYNLMIEDQNQQQLSSRYYALLDSATVKAEIHQFCFPDTYEGYLSSFISDVQNPPYTFEWSHGLTETGVTQSRVEDVSYGEIYGLTVTDNSGCTLVLDPERVHCQPSFEGTRASLSANRFWNPPTSEWLPLYGSISHGKEPFILEFSIGWDSPIPPDSFWINTHADVVIDSSELHLGRLGVRLHSFDKSISNGSSLVLFDFDTENLMDTIIRLKYLQSPVPFKYIKEGMEHSITYNEGWIVVGDRQTTSVAPLPELEITSCSPFETAIRVDFDNPIIEPVSFQWSGPNGFSDTLTSFPSGPFDEGHYKLAVVDEDGRHSEIGLVLVHPKPVLADFQIRNVTCNGGDNGAIELNYGLTEELDYLWSTGSTATGINSLEAGAYTVFVSDSDNCGDTLQFIVHEPSELQLDSFNLGCAAPGKINGAVLLHLSGGLAPYQLNWSDGVGTTDPFRDDLASGSYAITVTDQLGCQLELTGFDVVEGQDFAFLNDSIVCGTDSVNLVPLLPPGATIDAVLTSNGLLCAPCTWPLQIEPTSDAFYEIKISDGTCEYWAWLELSVDGTCVWPGDTDLDKQVDHFDLLNIGLAHGEGGPSRPNASTDWQAQGAMDWWQSTPISQVNYKHIDTDGNGQINDLDTLAISLNWGKMHNLLPGGGPGNGSPSSLLEGTPFYVEADTLYEGEQYGLPIILGDMDQPIDSFYGLAFTLGYDAGVVVPGSARVTFTPSWLGGPDDLLYMQRARLADGEVDIAVTRRDGQNQSGYGQIGTFWITIEDDIFLLEGSSDRLWGFDEIDFSITNVQLISSEETEQEVSPRITTAYLDGLRTETGTGELIDGLGIKVFPNPVKDELFIDPADHLIEKLTLRQITGETVLEVIPSVDHPRLSLAHLPDATYLLEITTNKGHWTQKVTLIH